MTGMRDDDVIRKLASILNKNPRSYVLLLGSGVSSNAGIPTAWDLTMKLVRELMPDNERANIEPENWYKGNYNQEVSFQNVLIQTTNNKDEKRNLIYDAFCDKEPTKTHKVIAKLIKAGIVQAVVTTNFDRLIEQALSQNDIEPKIIKSESDTANFKPLHQELKVSLIIKLCGDITDGNIKTSKEELSHMDKDLKNLLINRIFRDHNLIICGWSSQYDTGLSNIIKSVYSSNDNRKSVYWVDKNGLSRCSMSLANEISATEIKIDADRFFDSLEYEMKLPDIINSQKEPITRVTVVPPAIGHRDVQFEIDIKGFNSLHIKKEDFEYIDVHLTHNEKRFVANDFSNNKNLPSATTIPFHSGYPDYGKQSAQGIEYIEDKNEDKDILRLFINPLFYEPDQSLLKLVFSDKAGLITPKEPGQYRIRLVTNQNNRDIITEPFEIEDTPTFDDKCFVKLSNPYVAKESDYIIKFKNGNYPLLAYNDYVIVAFDTSIIPYNTESRNIFFKDNRLWSTWIRVPSVPFINGNTLGLTLPFNIKPNDYINIRIDKKFGIRNPYTASLYRLQVKTSRQNGYAVSSLYAVIPDNKSEEPST
jgi:NAD-dependent SIR2 family protein deacetylase